MKSQEIRTEISERIIDLIKEFDGSYKGAIILAGRLKYIAELAKKKDNYWEEKVMEGYIDEEDFWNCEVKNEI